YQEAVISSRMEGTISTMDEILRFDADHGESDAINSNVRNDVIETVLYRRALVSAQQALTDGYPFSSSLIKGIHQRLLSLGRGASKSPGMFKDEQNRSEEHTSELQSREKLVCRLLLEKKNKWRR